MRPWLLLRRFTILVIVLVVALTILRTAGAILHPSAWRLKSEEMLRSARTEDDLRKAVGHLGCFFRYPEGSWLAIRYTDTHSFPITSCSVALDSSGRWLHSWEHYCGTFAFYQHCVERTREMARATGLGEDEAARMLKAESRECSLAYADSLEEARRRLIAMGFEE